jgi:hypothetical protein
MDFNQKSADRKRKNYILRRSILDYGMGIVILGVGVLVLFAEKFGFQIAIDDLMRYMFVGLCVLYGGFRIYRGYSKQYFYDED